LRSELQGYVERHSNFHLYFAIESFDERWNQGKGRVTDKMIKEQFVWASSSGTASSPDNLILICGPPPMATAQVNNLLACNIPESQFFVYKDPVQG